MIAPATVLVATALSMAIVSVPRNRVLPLYIIGMCFVPADQALVLVGLDFKVLRILALVGCIRIAFKNEAGVIKLTLIDQLFITWSLVGTVAYILLWGTGRAVIYKLGGLVDSLLLYYVFRVYLRNFDDFRRVLHTLVVCLIFLTPLVVFEHVQGVNPFAIMGRDVTSFREGRIRCSAAFSHAILLGSFAASIVPIAAALAITSRSKIKYLYLGGAACAIYVTFASASSGPIIALLAGLLCVFLFKHRRLTGLATWSMVVVAGVLHVSMDAPVWHLISRIDLTGGSTGYHRFYLIDQTVKNFGEWALLGVKGVAHWGVWAGDVTSMYIAQAVGGGLANMVLFVWLLVLAMKIFWKSSMLPIDLASKWLIWGFFASFLSHSASFLSVAYFGQISMLLTLGFVAAAFFLERGPQLVALRKQPLRTRNRPLVNIL